MKKQIIVTIGREFGSGGHYIAQRLSEELGITLYDKSLIEGAIEEGGFSKEIMEKYDEKPINVFTSRRIGNYSSSIEEHVAEKIFEFIRSKADEGQSFVVVGRCADHILKDNPNAVHVFILGNKQDKLKRIMEVRNLPENKAKDLIKKRDKRRKTYHNYYCDNKWGDSRGYDVCLNSSKLGIDNTVTALVRYIKDFMAL